MVYEYQILTFMTIFFLFAWFPSSVAKGQTFGMKWLSSNREPVNGKALNGWGARSERAYNNLKDYFPAFVVPVLLLGIHGKFDAGTKWACTLFLIGRVMHFISYAVGNFILRFVFYVMSMVANVYLILKLFSF